MGRILVVNILNWASEFLEQSGKHVMIILLRIRLFFLSWVVIDKGAGIPNFVHYALLIPKFGWNFLVVRPLEMQIQSWKASINFTTLAFEFRSDFCTKCRLVHFLNIVNCLLNWFIHLCYQFIINYKSILGFIHNFFTRLRE